MKFRPYTPHLIIQHVTHCHPISTVKAAGRHWGQSAEEWDLVNEYLHTRTEQQQNPKVKVLRGNGDKVPRNCYFYVPNSRLHSSKSSVSWHLILGDLTFFALKFPGHPPAHRNHDSMNQNSRTLSYLILPIAHSTETSAYVSCWDHPLLKRWSTMWDHVGSTFPFQHGYKVG